MTLRLALVVVGLAAIAPIAGAQTPALAPATGDRTRGQELYEKTYRCYACHGYDGQTGSPRLVPMARAQDGFIAYVRKPATAGMPKFLDPTDRDLADVYAYIRSIPQAAPPTDSIPLLKGILGRRSTAN